MYLSKRSERDPHPCKFNTGKKHFFYQKRNKEIPEEQIQGFKNTQ